MKANRRANRWVLESDSLWGESPWRISVLCNGMCLMRVEYDGSIYESKYEVEVPEDIVKIARWFWLTLRWKTKGVNDGSKSDVDSRDR